MNGDRLPHAGPFPSWNFYPWNHHANKHQTCNPIARWDSTVCFPKMDSEWDCRSSTQSFAIGSKVAALMLCILLTACGANHETLTQHGVIHLTHAQALSNDDFLNLPAHTSDWHAVTLPDNWDITRPDQGGGVWYKIPIVLPHDATQSMAVLLANFGMNASIWWDEMQIKSGGSMTKPYARNWHTPLYASIGLKRLRQGQHWLYIRVNGYANDDSGLGDVYFGPESQLLPMYNRTYFLQRTVSMLALSCSVLLAFGCFLMWLLRRHQHVFIWMACATATWSVVISNFVVIDPLMPRFYWESLVDGSMELYSLFLMAVVFQILGERKSRLIWLLALLYLFGWSVILIFGNDRVLMDWSMPMHTVVLLLTVYLVGLCFMRWYQRRIPQALVLALAILTQLIFAVHDWWTVYFDNQLESVLIMQVGPTLTLLMVALWMLYAFSKALQESEAHTAHVEAEVERVTTSLQLEQKNMAQLQKKQVLNDERERFTRELHDGLGGYLAAISAMLHDGVRDEKMLTQTIDQALLEMRMMMDGVGEDCNDVGMLLGMLRHRLQQPLQAWGIQVGWNLTGLPMQCTLKDGYAIHLLRIVQEALTNAARHANADWVEVRATLLSDAPQPMARIEIIDNGCGWDVPPIAGRGLNHMHQRAEMMEAALKVTAAPDNGVHISLTVPVSIITPP